MKSVVLISFVMLLSLVKVTTPVLIAQEIDFGSYASYTIDVSPEGDLAFGYVMNDSGTYSIELINALEIDILGVEYLDVFVDITVAYNSQLILEENEANIDDPQRSIPLTLEAAFSNVGELNNQPAQATVIPISNGVGTARFPIRRDRFTAPGPPPPPPTGAFDQASVEDTAVLYLYGSIDVGNVDSGPYIGEITIDITYEFPP